MTETLPQILERHLRTIRDGGVIMVTRPQGQFLFAVLDKDRYTQGEGHGTKEYINVQMFQCLRRYIFTKEWNEEYQTYCWP